MTKRQKYYIPIDRSGSPTHPTETWKNPLLDTETLLLVADGAVHFERQVNANIRRQLAEARAEIDELRRSTTQ